MVTFSVMSLVTDSSLGIVWYGYLYLSTVKKFDIKECKEKITRYKIANNNKNKKLLSVNAVPSSVCLIKL